MGVYRALHEGRELFYYLRADRTIFLEVESDSVSVKFIQRKMTKEELDSLNIDFSPVSHREFEEKLSKIKELINLNRVINIDNKTEARDHLDILGR